MQEQGYNIFEKFCLIISRLFLLLLAVFGLLFALTGIPALIGWWVSRHKTKEEKQ